MNDHRDMRSRPFLKELFTDAWGDLMRVQLSPPHRRGVAQLAEQGYAAIQTRVTRQQLSSRGPPRNRRGGPLRLRTPQVPTR